MTTLIDISKHEKWIRHTHTFLQKHFGPDELEAVESYLPTKGELPTDMVIVGGNLPSARGDTLLDPTTEDEVQCAALLSLIPLYGTDGKKDPTAVIGAVGHALVDSSLRGKGIGKRLNTYMEKTMQEYARLHKKSLQAFVLESEPPARFFWSKVGYLWPQNTQYWQPPLGYNDHGQPVLPSIPMLFMIKHPKYKEKIPKQTTEEFIYSMLRYWYRDEIPQMLSRVEAQQNAYNFLDRQIISPSLRSLVKDPIALVNAGNLPEEHLHLSKIKAENEKSTQLI